MDDTEANDRRYRALRQAAITQNFAFLDALFEIMPEHSEPNTISYARFDAAIDHATAKTLL